jgi:hypothetical protein
MAVRSVLRYTGAPSAPSNRTAQLNPCMIVHNRFWFLVSWPSRAYEWLDFADHSAQIMAIHCSIQYKLCFIRRNILLTKFPTSCTLCWNHTRSFIHPHCLQSGHVTTMGCKLSTSHVTKSQSQVHNDLGTSPTVVETAPTPEKRRRESLFWAYQLLTCAHHALCHEPQMCHECVQLQSCWRFTYKFTPPLSL